MLELDNKVDPVPGPLVVPINPDGELGLGIKIGIGEWDWGLGIGDWDWGLGLGIWIRIGDL